MTGATAYGLPAPELITFGEAEDIGREIYDRWELMVGGSPPLTREDLAWGDIVQFTIRRAAAIARERLP